jgi:hypothetical protein
MGMLRMAVEPWDGGARIHQALAPAHDSTNPLAKRNMNGKGDVNLGPGNAS